MSQMHGVPIHLDTVNAMSKEEFSTRFADVAEHSPWIAQAAWELRPFASVDAMVAAFESAMRSAGDDDKLALVRAHPDLAGRAALAGEVARESRTEQAGAGLQRLSPEEFARFTELNALYKKRFGFPFILAVKGATKDQILASFEERIGADPSEEFQTALTQIARIFRFRIEERVTSAPSKKSTDDGGQAMQARGDKRMGVPSQKVLGSRAQAMIDALARHSSEEGNLTRLYLSREHRAAAADVARWMREAGLQVTMDNLGTVRGYLAPSGPGNGRTLLIGSHIDTVRDAGRFDGNLGVVAGILAVDSVRQRAAALPFGIEVLAFGDEEGVRFPTALLASSAVAGKLDRQALQASDAGGVTVRDALIEFGCDPDKVGAAAYDRDAVSGYLEVHIEQGPVLETEDLPVGIVTAIAGASRYRVSVRGEAGHAGTVPMALRHDALAAASELILEVEKIARAGTQHSLVATVGEIAALPGAVNVIPGEVRFSLDLRAANDEARLHAFQAVQRLARSIGTRRGCIVDIERFHDAATAPCSPRMQNAMEEAITGMGLKSRRMMSGAGHDGQAMAKLTDIGMIFVRCRAGISHNPREHATSADMGTAIDALIRTIDVLAQQERTGS